MTTPPLERPLPDLATTEQGGFWHAANMKRLVVRTCRACSKPLPGVQHHCHHCGAVDLAWKDAAGAGVVYTFTIVRSNAPHPFFKARIPYVLAYVDLEGGARILTEITGCAVEDVTVGMPVVVDWAAAGSGYIPVFRPNPGVDDGPTRRI